MTNEANGRQEPSIVVGPSGEFSAKVRAQARRATASWPRPMDAGRADGTGAFVVVSASTAARPSKLKAPTQVKKSILPEEDPSWSWCHRRRRQEDGGGGGLLLAGWAGSQRSPRPTSPMPRAGRPHRQHVGFAGECCRHVAEAAHQDVRRLPAPSALRLSVVRRPRSLHQRGDEAPVGSTRQRAETSRGRSERATGGGPPAGASSRR